MTGGMSSGMKEMPDIGSNGSGREMPPMHGHD
jgi:hypothetical protein